MLRDKYVRQTRREIDEGTVREVYEDGFPEPKSKPFTYVDDEYVERAIRCSRTYYEYAKDICENYRMDLRRYKLIRERKQYIGVSNREAYQAMCEDLAFAQQSLKTVLNDYADLFRKRFSEGRHSPTPSHHAPSAYHPQSTTKYSHPASRAFGIISSSFCVVGSPDRQFI